MRQCKWSKVYIKLGRFCTNSVFVLFLHFFLYLRWNGTLKTVKSSNLLERATIYLKKNATIQFSGKVYSLLIIYHFARLGFWVAKGNGFVYILLTLKNNLQKFVFVWNTDSCVTPQLMYNFKMYFSHKMHFDKNASSSTCLAQKVFEIISWKFLHKILNNATVQWT